MELAAPRLRLAAETAAIQDDAVLLHRIAAGDRDALEALYQRYQRPLFRYLLQLTTDRQLAEELLQDTLVAVWKAAGEFQGRSSVRTWLIGIARRQAHNALRRSTPPVADPAELEEMAADDPDPESAALAAADREALARALAHLAPLHREVIVLTFVHGLSYQELADVLGIPVGTVKSRLSNAKRALSRAIQPQAEPKAELR